MEEFTTWSHTWHVLAPPHSLKALRQVHKAPPAWILCCEDTQCLNELNQKPTNKHLKHSKFPMGKPRYMTLSKIADDRPVFPVGLCLHSPWSHLAASVILNLF